MNEMRSSICHEKISHESKRNMASGLNGSGRQREERQRANDTDYRYLWDPNQGFWACAPALGKGCGSNKQILSFGLDSFGGSGHNMEEPSASLPCLLPYQTVT